jgi:hypothetical protein
VGSFVITVRANGRLVNAEKTSILRTEWQSQAQYGKQ